MDRRSAIKHVVGSLGAWKLLNSSALANPPALAGAYRIQSSQITASINKQGEITGLVLSPAPAKHLPVMVQGRTVLAGCTVREVSANKLAAGGVEFTKTLTHAADGQSCRLTERFLPAESGSLRWELEILGDGMPWSTPIETHLSWPATAETKFWNTWGDSRPEDSPGWNDPLVPAAFGVRSLHYGAKDVMQSQGFSVPISTVLDAANDAGLSLALDPRDSVIELDLNTTAAGEVVFSRSNNRISKDRPVRFALDLVAHAADWRAGLGWMVERYPDQFNPPNPLTYQIAGNAAYAEYEGNELDAYKFFSMGFRVNWKASFDFYTMGLFLPLEGDNVEYVCPRINEATDEFPTSVAHLREYSEQMRRAGFYVLNYFNVGEFGHLIKKDPPGPPRKAKNDADLWRDANDFAWYVIPDALMYSEDGKLLHGGQGDVLVDIGEPVYQRVMLDQARRHIEKFPASSGLALDEMQFNRRYNFRRDDGLTWKNGKPARALVNSWKDWMNQLGPLMVKANKVIYSNPLYRRMDLMTHLDGFYDEFAFVPYSLNTNIFLALRKPFLSWTINIYDPDPDAYFQRHLHLGANVTVPYPMDNHEIMPSGVKIDRCFVDYGPLFDALQGRTWVLHPHAIEVEENKAKANLFAIPGGYLAMVTFGGDNSTVNVTLRGLEKLPGQQGFLIESLRPGEVEWSSLAGIEKGDVMALNVPLKRGCSAVKLSSFWIKPEKHYFIKDHTITLGTTLGGAQVCYTLDGKEPGIDSLAYSQPFAVSATTLLKAATFKDGLQIGPVLVAEYVRTLPPAPWIDPFNGTFKDQLDVTLSHGYPMEGAEIRYTVDGGEVTWQSPLYSAPFEISSTTTLRARTFIPGLDPSVCASHVYSKLPPPAPPPDVYLTDLTPTKSSFVSHYTMKKDRSLADAELSLAGQKFPRGVGSVSPSTLIYQLDPTYEAFVATVGIDDSVMTLPRKSPYTEIAMFQVFARNEREELLLDETPMLVPGEAWPINVKIPIQCQEIRLVAKGGMDWEFVNWSNAGFILDHTNQGEELLREVK